jgi:hypothetical protein
MSDTEEEDFEEFEYREKFKEMYELEQMYSKIEDSCINFVEQICYYLGQRGVILFPHNPQFGAKIHEIISETLAKKYKSEKNK